MTVGAVVALTIGVAIVAVGIAGVIAKAQPGARRGARESATDWNPKAPPRALDGSDRK